VTRFAAVALTAALSAAGCGGEAVIEIPRPDPSGMEPEVVAQLDELRATLEQDRSAANWGRLGGGYHAYGLWDAAGHCYEQAKALAPQEFRWTYFLALAEEKTGAGPSRVQQRLREAERLRSDYAPLHIRLGRLQLELGSYNDAGISFTRAASLDPRSAAALRGLGQAWLAVGDPARAVEALDRATRLDSNDAAAWSALALALAQLGQDDRSRQAAARAGQLRPHQAIDDPELRAFVEPLALGPTRLLASAGERVRNGEFAAALEELSRVERRLPHHPDVRRLQARAHLGLGQAEQAVALLEEVLELDPQQLQLHTELASVLEKSGRHDEAVEQFSRALAIAPRDPGLLAELNRVFPTLNDLDAQIDLYTRLTQLLPNDMRIQMQLGGVWLRKGNAARAVLAFKRVVELDPVSPDARYQLGVAYERLGRVTDARKQFAEAVDLDPHHIAREKLP